jgi:hypothetical protein
MITTDLSRFLEAKQSLVALKWRIKEVKATKSLRDNFLMARPPQADTHTEQGDDNFC